MTGRELISKKTRTEFREFLVSWTLREIENEFAAAGLEPDRSYEPGIGGQRREFVEQYYHRMDFTNPNDVARVLQVYEAILTHCAAAISNPGSYADPATLKREYDKLLAWLRRDGYDFVDGRLRLQGDNALLLQISATAESLNADYLAAQVQRLRQAVEHDSDLAIGQAKELVETCCKTILATYDETDVNRLDLVHLVKLTMGHLKLLPDHIQDGTKGEKTVKAVLGNLAMIAQGMAELRNLYGTGHGKHGQHKPLPTRHARLAVSTACTLATFLFETHEARTSQSN